MPELQIDPLCRIRITKFTVPSECVTTLFHSPITFYDELWGFFFVKLMEIVMRLFVSLAVKVTHVAYLGLIIPVPTEYMEEGYIAADQSGDIWAFESLPKQESTSTCLDLWNNGSDGATRIITEDFFQQVSEESWFLDNWTSTCIKLSELPVVT